MAVLYHISVKLMYFQAQVLTDATEKWPDLPWWTKQCSSHCQHSPEPWKLLRFYALPFCPVPYRSARNASHRGAVESKKHHPRRVDQEDLQETACLSTKETILYYGTSKESIIVLCKYIYIHTVYIYIHSIYIYTHCKSCTIRNRNWLLLCHLLELAESLRSWPLNLGQRLDPCWV